jgi:hypothetical protein
LDSIFIQTTQGTVPEMSVSAQIHPVKGNEYSVEFIIENTGDEILEEVYGRFIWPVEAKHVRMQKNDWRIVNLKPSTQQTVRLAFTSTVSINDLPDVLIRLDITDYNRWFRQELDPVLLSNSLRLHSPTVQGTPPVLVDLDVNKYLEFQHSVLDDGEVSMYEAWWNGEKVHWQPNGDPTTLNLLVEKGHNNLYIEVTDNIGLQTKQIFTVYGSTSQDGESHLIEGDAGTPIGPKK